MRHSIVSALALVTLAGPAGIRAQGLSAASLRGAPQFTTYSFDVDGVKSSVSELAIPIAFAMPINERLTVDVATAFAHASFHADGAPSSSISGLTDMQVRFNYSLPGDAIMITAGLNLPTGQYKVDEDKLAPAGQIGNDFLAFPVSSFGNGFGGTGGVAYARPLGIWNLGVGASFRKSFEFDAFQAGNTTVTFTPATEFRLRAGVDREIEGGRVLLGAVLSAFGDDKCEGCEGGTTAATGTRIIGQAAIDKDLGDKQLYVGGWLLHRGKGEQLGGVAPADNIQDVTVALGMTVGTIFLEPSLELRMRQTDGASGSIVYGGVRTRLQRGTLEYSPSLAIGVGSMEDASMSSVKLGVTVRLVR